MKNTFTALAAMLMVFGGAQAKSEASNHERQEQAQNLKFKVGQVPSFLEIARNSDGSVKLMSMSQGKEYCAEQGAHLPSARELAQLAMSFGARGIVDSCGSDIMCYQVQTRNADGKRDEFYFSAAGYQSPAGDMGRNLFWSSSLEALYWGGTEDPFALNGLKGTIGYAYSRIYGLAIVCVAGR